MTRDALVEDLRASGVPDPGPDLSGLARVWEVPLTKEAEAMLAAMPPGTKLGGGATVV